jgi:predicted transcriptional regulator
VTDIAQRLRKPWTTIKRTLEALYVLELVERVEVEAKDDGNDDKADYAADDRSERKNTKKAKPKIMHYVLAANISTSLTALDPPTQGV